MPKPKVAFVVGHRDWGKSATLRALTGGSYHQRRCMIEGVEFFIRRMSNDDYPDGFIELMRSIDPTVEPNIIAALCPNFEDPAAETEAVLETLRKKAISFSSGSWKINSERRRPFRQGTFRNSAPSEGRRSSLGFMRQMQGQRSSSALSPTSSWRNTSIEAEWSRCAARLFPAPHPAASSNWTKTVLPTAWA